MHWPGRGATHVLLMVFLLWTLAEGTARPAATVAGEVLYPAQVGQLDPAARSPFVDRIPVGRGIEGQPRLLMDLVIWVTPPDPRGHCIVLDAGELSITLQLVGDDPIRPVHFSLNGYRGVDASASLDERLDDRRPRLIEAPLGGGTYCYFLANEAPVPPHAPAATTSSLGQDVAVKLTLAPRYFAQTGATRDSWPGDGTHVRAIGPTEPALAESLRRP